MSAAPEVDVMIDPAPNAFASWMRADGRKHASEKDQLNPCVDVFEALRFVYNACRS